ncbi:ATP-binding cassette domain-containing protein [Acidianus sulfidivorans JP7]|uniref:ABC transporter ATP-binding protein n=1 Tax=Acidianus sulfidivorans JP7 TaxID=619593 RepID=A0A2U9ILF0_9CREN|nr:ABC transporter ATP-binding protein [Acidianus sulfidivorans]AWR96879.1 ATP-binding cassette domain-containing protein [Acidianus sulfidivorans JP7]
MQIRMEKINVKFGGGFLSRGKEFYALRDLTTTIDGNTLIIGESGAGKTTLGRVIVGLQKISSGTYEYNKINIWKNKRVGLKTIRKEIQYVIQDPFSAFNPNKTLGESIGYVVKKYIGKNNVKENTISLLKSVGLTENEYYKYPHQMSGGQLQRANIARALATQPKVIVADEPTSMLDASYRLSILNLLIELANKGLTIIMITHDLALARYFEYKLKGTKSLILYKGRLVEEGTMSSIIEEPLHPYTQYLMHNTIDINSSPSKIQEFVLKNENQSKGCPFYPYCEYRQDICKDTFPSPKEVKGRKVYCYLY